MPVSLAHARMEILKTQEYRDACRTSEISGPPQYVEYWPFGLYLEDLGHDFSYFGGLGTPIEHVGEPLRCPIDCMWKLECSEASM